MIVVEGPDGSGKTTLVNMLKNELGLPVAPRVVSQKAEAMTDLRQWVNTNLLDGRVPQIFDRHRLISETIYGPILRPESEPGFVDLTWMGPRIKLFYELKPLIIYCLPSLDTVLENLKGDPDNVSVIDYTDRIYQSYVSRISLDHAFAPLRPLVWNYERTPTIGGKPHWFNQVRNYAEELTKQKGL